MQNQQKRVEVVPIEPPPPEQRVQREAHFAQDGPKTRYSLPTSLQSASPVGYRHRVRLERSEAEALMPLLSLERPDAFVEDFAPVLEEEHFEEASLGILTARQSTNYRGHREVLLGPEDSDTLASILRGCEELDGEVLDNATHTRVALSRPYRTPFTLLLTFIGHKPFVSLGTVLLRALRKKVEHLDDIPTIGYLQQIHLGVWADAVERAAVVASEGKRRANVIMKPFTPTMYKRNRKAARQIEDLIGLSAKDRRKGWRVGFVAQVGEVDDDMFDSVSRQSWRRLGANMLSFRSERIQPGVNQEDKAPAPYQTRQDMDVPDHLTVMAGRAAYNAFVHWMQVPRELSKELLLLERIDVLTPNGKERLREVRQMLNDVTDHVMKGLPLWADLPTGKALSRNAARGKKAFALAGQRIYIGGLDREHISAEDLDWDLAVRAFGAASARSALVAEIMGCVDLPEECDLLAGICLMAGPVNQNDIGKSFYGQRDLLSDAYDGDPTSLLVWTLKAKTVADPVGNEEQLMNPKRKGALVDLRPGPHDVIEVKREGRFAPLRKRDGVVNTERAYADVGNFVTDPDGREVPGNRGSVWPEHERKKPLW